MRDVEKEVLGILDTYRSTVLAKDVDAFMRLYDVDVRVFDAWGEWSYEGVGAWRGVVENWFSSLEDGTVAVTCDDIRIDGDGPMASLSAVVTYAAVSARGEALRSMQNRISWVLKGTGSALRIVHEHTSAPLNFEDGKAILTRETAP